MLQKLLTLLQSTPVKRDRFVAHPIGPEGSIGGPAKQLANPASKSSGPSYRASLGSRAPLGGPPADRRLITVRTADPISSRGIEEAPHSAAPLAKSWLI
jgi:hypothetical protein